MYRAPKPYFLFLALTVFFACTSSESSSSDSWSIGKKADLIVLEENPLEDLEHLRSLELVIKDGYEHKISDENKVQLRQRTAVSKAFQHCH